MYMCSPIYNYINTQPTAESMTVRNSPEKAEERANGAQSSEGAAELTPEHSLKTQRWGSFRFRVLSPATVVSS